MGEERPAFKRQGGETGENHGLQMVVRAKALAMRGWQNARDGVNRLDRRDILRRIAMAAGVFAGVSLAGAAVLFVVLAAIEPTLPTGADLYSHNRPQALTFLDKDGKLAGVRGAIVGDRLKLADMPPYLPAAFLATEDRRFYRHNGIDYRGLARAALVDLKAMRIVQGGSTITQQVVKLVYLTPERTFSRKLQELAGARALEKQLSKDAILELYLNRLYLGSGAYGVDGAAQVYFGKSARAVTLAEAAMLAALTRAPTAFSPRRDLEAAQARANKVLMLMLSQGLITERQAAPAMARPATVIDATDDFVQDYFLDAAADEAKRLLPAVKGDITIVTTLDPAMQKLAQAQVANTLKKRGPAMQAGQAALVAMTTDGQVRALVGGRDYAESPFNRATKAYRQPGSAFKPFVYLAAIEYGLDPWTVRVDRPIAIKDWAPDNYDQTHAGAITLETAFARSINTVAIGLGQEVGLNSVIGVAHRLGIQSPLQPNASLPLGTSEVTPLELTAAYAAFAALGNRVHPHLVREVRDADGGVLIQRAPSPAARVFAEADALAMNMMMYDVVQWGTGRGAAVPGHEVAGKTGTSADFRDAWFVGFSPELVTGVWVGNDDFSPMKKVTGGALPAQIWSGFMRGALRKTPWSELPRLQPPEPDPFVAEDYGNPFGAVGRFLDRLFGGTPEPATPAPPAVAGTTFVFENGETGQRQVFRDDRRGNAPLDAGKPASMPYDRDIP